MLPLLYHAHHTRYMDDLSFWSDLAHQQGRAILELGCGTGRLGTALAQAGFSIVGLDLDFDSLAFYNKSIPPDLVHPPLLFQADLASFHLDRSFPLIFLACNTYSSLSPQVRERGIGGIRAHLESGGVFAASMPNPAVLQKLPAQAEPEEEDEFLHPLTGNPVIVSSAWKKSREGVRFQWIYDHLLPNGEVQRSELGVTHFIRSAREILDELRSANLEIQAQYGDYDHSIYRPSSPYLIFLARKR